MSCLIRIEQIVIAAEAEVGAAVSLLHYAWRPTSEQFFGFQPRTIANSKALAAPHPDDLMTAPTIWWCSRH